MPKIKFDVYNFANGVGIDVACLLCAWMEIYPKHFN